MLRSLHTGKVKLKNPIDDIKLKLNSNKNKTTRLPKYTFGTILPYQVLRNHTREY